MTTLARVSDVRVVPLPRHGDARGMLTVLECGKAVPFEVRRTFVITDVPPGGTRGCHANMRTSELVTCAAGAVTVVVSDGHATREERVVPGSGACLVPATLWVELKDFAPGTVCVVLADTDYEEARHAYIREFEAWRTARERHHAA